ncbi:Clp protease N-terminal domain-containing protein [Thermogemmatispora tikiterensis]|uniref:Clp protease N-terminal domain-containing protein n=1 Tax=Thermogemmatispora tikiterensis TaxID=1825093 RepID=UPI000DD8E2E3
MPWTPRAKQVFTLAKEEAQRLKVGRIGTEHLLLGLLRDGDNLGAGMLEMLGIDLAEARRQMLRVIGKGE